MDKNNKSDINETNEADETNETDNKNLKIMEEIKLDQGSITKRIKFGVSHMPPYPIVWSFGSMSPVIDSHQLESIKQFQIRDKEVLKQISRLVKPLVQNNYSIEYFDVKQKIFKEIQTASLSFHAWLHTKLSQIDDKLDANDMTNAFFLKNMIIGAVSVNDFIAEPTPKSFGGKNINKLVLNNLGERAVYLRRQLKSPKNENGFRIVSDHLVDVKFVSVGYSPELLKAVVTMHILHLY